ncbi:MAG: acyl-CoA dehydrogenase [Actinophytocola sp.]|uniref:acyl-CoA dehydrogenase n=1 Tax=Actinophytocola sp. TaxID=1872138 RepID=UPI0013255BB0|nr:acyl-CoA dehydrogenase [Actinophytocola sp.]MPZ80711.1 acyl-CoA dehydrogenase [Actinophytocola sp.]
MSIAITEVQLAIQDSVRDVSKRAGVLATVRASEPGAAEPAGWRTHWPDLATLGLFAIALPERLGGVGGTLVDQAAAVEQAAEDLVPGPVLPTVLAALLVVGSPAEPLARLLAEGEATAGVALTPGTLTTEPGGDGGYDGGGGIVVSGTTDVVLGGHAGAYLLLPARADGGRTVWFVLEPSASGATVSTVDPLDFSRPLGRITLDRAPVPADRVLTELGAAAPSNTVTTLAATLFAAEAAGVARWCLRTAVDHAKVREQFDRPIGSFQAVKHLCAEMLCRAEQAGALAWDAARDPRSLSAPAAAAIALDAAVANAKDCIQVLGGIGFTWEHDAHLYLRRAVASRQLAGGGARWRRQVADLALAGVRRALTVDTDDEATRGDARAFAMALASAPAEERRVRLAESGYLMPHWPRPYGLAASPREQVVIDEELDRAGIGRPDLVIGGWAVPTILEHGTPDQQERFVPPTLRGALRWCQLFSEPGAGSDLAALRTKAVRVDGGWRLDGQKVWTSDAVGADWAICLARTDPDAPKHAGITYFLVDMRTDGITLRPLREITGEARFNEVFLDGVFVPDDCVVGEVDGGWRLARTTLANERVAIGAGSSLGEGVERLLALATDRGLVEDDGIRERLGALVAQGLSVSLVDHRETLRRLGGRDPGPGSSVCKLVGVRQRQDVAEAAVDLLGPAGAAVDATSGPVLHEFLLTRCLSIAGGTTQVLLNLVGERILGLPREK